MSDLPSFLHHIAAQNIGMETARLELEGMIAHILKAKIYKDGDQWCVLYGENIQQGICGFGTTPHKAVWDFEEEYFGRKIK